MEALRSRITARFSSVCIRAADNARHPVIEGRPSLRLFDLTRNRGYRSLPVAPRRWILLKLLLDDDDDDNDDDDDDGMMQAVVGIPIGE